MALQAPYVIEALRTTAVTYLTEALDEPHDIGFDAPRRGETVESLEAEREAADLAAAAARLQAVELAVAAWGDREAADAAVQERAPDWPTHRQPPIDRAILRLAIHELRSGRNDTRVVLNEAVELAKQFGSAQSPAFINGVLDRLKHLAVKESGSPGASRGPAAPDDPWLSDALQR